MQSLHHCNTARGASAVLTRAGRSAWHRSNRLAAAGGGHARLEHAPARTVRRAPARRPARRPCVASTRTLGPAPETTAAWPSARSASTSAMDAGNDARRGSWCSQSRVAGSSRSGRRVSACTSRAARPELRAASACGDVRRGAPRGRSASAAASRARGRPATHVGVRRRAAPVAPGRGPASSAPGRPSCRRRRWPRRCRGGPRAALARSLASRGRRRRRRRLGPCQRRVVKPLCRNDSRDDGRRRGAQPAAVRDARCGRPGAGPRAGATPSAAQAAQHGADDQVRSSRGTSLGPLALDARSRSPGRRSRDTTS